MDLLKLRSRQSGQGMTEYIIIVALIAIAAIGVYKYLGTTIRSQTSAIANEVAGKDGTAGTTAAADAAALSDGQRAEKGLDKFTGGAPTGGAK